jgi:hypothetical protein
MNNGDMPADPTIDSNDESNGTCGLTKREHFAAMAMQGILSAHREGNAWLDGNSRPVHQIAESAIRHADALLSALKDQP